MKGIILAAGRGSRMQHLTNDIPKCLTKFNNKTLLEYQIDAFQQAGIDSIGIVTGYLDEKIQNKSLIKIHNMYWHKTQMVSSLMCAKKWLKGSDFIVSYSDIFYSKEAILSLLSSPYNLSVLYDPDWLAKWSERFDNPLDDAESFIIDENKIISNIGERQTDINKIQGQYMGLIRINRVTWEEICRCYQSLKLELQEKIHFTQFLSVLIKNNITTLHGIPFTGEWGEIDSEKDLKAYIKIYPTGIKE